ncbi:MAG: VPS10 domain-containing protein [Wenzhouxiangella sp.]
MILFFVSVAVQASGRTLSVVVDGELSSGDPCPVDVEATSFADLFIALECAASGDVIEFGPGEFSLTNPIDPGSGSAIDIEGSLTIRGQGQAATVLDRDTGGAGFFRAINGESHLFTIENLAISGSGAGDPSIDVNGGSVRVDRVIVREGFFTVAGAVRVTNGGELELNQFQIRDSNVTSTDLLSISNAHVRGNDVVIAGNTDNSSIISAGGSSIVELTNLTVTNNEVDRVFDIPGSDLHLAFATIAHNTVLGNFPNPAVLSGSGARTLTHVLIDAPDFRDCAGGTIISQGHNISAPGAVDNTCSAFNQPTDSVNQPSGIRAPADTGGGVLSVPLTADSIARNGASECVDTKGNPVPRDGRGFTRPAGQPCSIGSWQYFPTAAISQVVFDPGDPQRRYAATLGQGVFVSSDGGVTWASLGSDLDGLAVADLAVSPSDAEILLAATTRDGVFRSSDGGASWSASSTGLTGEALTVNRLQFDPADAQVVLAATNNGLYRSDNGGATWARIDGGLPAEGDD